MKTIDLEWEEFVYRFRKQQITPKVDLRKGHQLMKSKIAPKPWRVAIHFFSMLILIALPAIFIAFFFIKWWICILLFFSVGIISSAIRKTAAGAVIECSLNDASFFYEALASDTLRIYSDQEIGNER